MGHLYVIILTQNIGFVIIHVRHKFNGGLNNSLSKLSSIDSDYGLSSGRRQAITWINAEI